MPGLRPHAFVVVREPIDRGLALEGALPYDDKTWIAGISFRYRLGER